MSFSSAMRHGVLLAVLVLSNASLDLAYRRPSSDGEVNTVIQPKKTKPQSHGINHTLCDGSSTPIFPPSITYRKVELFSVRASMWLQILPDGTVNGTFQWNKYVKVNVEILSEHGCHLRIQGVASQRYLAMDKNGALVTQTESDQTRTVFTSQLNPRGFLNLKNGDHFIAMSRGRGRIKKIRADENGKSHRKSTKFLLILVPVLPPKEEKEKESRDLRQT